MRHYTGKKAKLVAFIRERLAVDGRFTTHEALAATGPYADVGRRIRELRRDGFVLHNHFDRADLSPGQWLVEAETDRKAEGYEFESSISTKLRPPGLGA